MINKTPAIASWSSGKDSCLALYKALKSGFDVKCLLNFISREHKRGCFHGIESKLINLQAQAIGIPLVQKETTADMEKYEEEFKAGVLELKNTKNIDAMIFGDIYLDEHKNWVERVCRDVSVTAVEPLWNNPPDNLLEEFINLGFKAVVVSCQAKLFDKNFVGRLIDKEFLKEMQQRKICPCGENGEFHTFVIDGPLFKKRIDITKSEAVLKKGFWEYWFLDIKDYKVN